MIFVLISSIGKQECLWTTAYTFQTFSVAKALPQIASLSSQQVS